MTGKRIVEMVREDLKPSDILTRAAFENAIVVELGARRLDQCADPPERHRAPHRRRAGQRRLGEARLQDPADRQPAAGGRVPRRGLLPRRRRAGGGRRADRQGKIQPALTANGKTLIENCEGQLHQRPQGDLAVRQADEEERRLPQPQGQPVRLRDHEDQRDHAGIPRSATSRTRRTRWPSKARAIVFDGPEDYHHRIDDPKIEDRRELHAVHARRRPDRLSRRGRGGQHARARLPAEEGHHRAALHRRRPAVGHLGLAVDPQRLARGGDRRRAGAAARPATACAST